MTSDLPPAVAPFHEWPEQFAFEGGRAWFTAIGQAIVTQTHCDRATPEAANSLNDVFDRLSEARVEARMPKLTILHDWRSLRGVAAGTQQVWLDRTLARGPSFQNCEIFLALDVQPFIRMVMRTAALTTQLVAGQRTLTFVDSLEPVLAERRIQVPAHGFLDSWLAA